MPPTRCHHFAAMILAVALGPTAALALTATGFVPANGATAVCVDTPLTITFDTVPTIGTTGAVRIYSAAGTLVDTIDLALNATNGTQSRSVGGTSVNTFPVIVSGNSALVFPHAGVLAYNTTYYVTVDAAVFPGFAGVSGSTAWRFTTKTSAPSASSTYLVVAEDGSGDFRTVQGAVDFIPAANTTRRHINIRNGIYQEIVRVSGKHMLAFRGQNRKRTVISYPNNNNLNANTNTRPMVNVIANDISFDNLTLHNTTPDGGSQAEALRVNAQRCVVNNCDLRSYQDTFLVNSATDTAFFKDSLIEGDADFIWGTGRAVFQSCEIKSLSGGYVCAMRNPAGQYGAVFLDCRFTRSAGVTGVVFGRVDPNTFPDSAVAVVNCAVDAHITAAGWTLSNPGPTTGLRYWEYQSTDLAGVLLDVGGRASFSAQINGTQASALRNLPTTFGGWTPIPPLPAFPGAEGAGANTIGGRGGDLYFVTNLNDSGAGSLRDAIATTPAGGRTIVFRVGGTINLASPLSVNKRRLTLAGQTAPGGGICLRNYALRIDADDVIVRHVRSRLGTGASQEDDAITVWGGINVILDHCSASWSVDEVLSCTGDSDNVTAQWCFVTEALDHSIHSKGPHGFGSLLVSTFPARFSFHHNLYAHNQSRNPRPGSQNGSVLGFDFRNNVIYNWGYFAGYSASSPEATDMNYVGNYLVKGPGSTTDSAFRGGGATTRIHQSGNRLDLNKNGGFDGTDTGWSAFSGTYVAQSAAFDFFQTNTTESADRALQRVLSECGARPWDRDSLDAAIAADVGAGSGGFVDTTDQAGGYPVLAAGSAPVDTDNDGIPNFFEFAAGSDPGLPNNNSDADGDGYTDLEEYLDWQASPHAVTPTGQAVDVDLTTANGSRAGLAYTVESPVNGSVVLLADGHTARFTPTAGFQGVGGFSFRFTASGQTLIRSVGVAVTSGLPRDLDWVGTTAVWDIATTANFTDGTSAVTYRQGDSVRFLQTGSNPTITVSGTITPATMTVDATKNYSFSGGSLSGSMNLIKAGSGTLTLGTANAYTGGTSITGGTVVLGNIASLGTGPVSIGNAGLNIANFNITNPLTFSGTNTLTARDSAKVNAVSGDGTVNLNITSGLFDLNGNLTGFGGAFVLTTNTNIRFVNGSGSGGAIFDLGSGTGSTTVRNNLPAIAMGGLRGGTGTIVYGQSNNDSPTTFTIGGSGQDCMFSGAIRNGTFGPASITSVTKTGAGTLTLAGTSNYTGATRVNEGTLRVTGALGATAVTVADGASLTGSGTIGGSVVVETGGNISSGSGGAGTLAMSGGLTLNGTPLTFDLSNTTTPGGGVNDLYTIGGALTLNGTIVVTPNLLNGPLATGTYTLIGGGSSTVNNATFVWGGPPNGGRQSVAFDASTPGTLKLVVTGTPSVSLVWTGTPGSTWDSGDPVNPAIGAANWRNGTAADRFVKYDAVTFDDTLTNGGVVLSGGVEPASVTVNNTSKAVAINSNAGSINGAASLVKSGTGTLTLDGANTYSGGTTLNAGTIQLASDNANTNAFGSGPITLKGGTLVMYSNFNATTSSNTSTWDLIVPTGFTSALNCDSRCSLRGTLTGGGTLNLHIPDIRTGIDADWSAFTGQINVTTDANGGEFRIGNNYSPTGLPLAAMDLAANVKLLYVGIVDIGAGSKVTLGSLTGAAGSILQGGPTVGRTFTWEVGQRNTDSVFHGTLTEQAAGCITALTKVGTGMLKLTAACGHTGPTAVSGGSLIVNGSITSSPVTLNAGTLLGGTGSLAATTIQDDAVLSPGENGPGVLTFTNGLALAAESVSAFDLGTTRDRVDVTGNLTLNGIINFTNGGGLLPGTYTIIQYTGTLGGSGLSVGTVPAEFGCTLDTATPGQVKVVVTTTLSPFQQWQILWFGDYQNPNAAPGGDPDDDGQTNNDEFIAGTDPTSSTSVATLVWRGDGAGNQWDIRTSATFWNGNRLSAFTNGNPVLFDATGSANPTVNLTGLLAPAAVSVNNTDAFTFAGPGALAGYATLTKSGTGILILQTSNSHTGGTVIDRGTVNLSGNQAAATGGYALNIVNSATSTLNLGNATQTAATTAVTAVSKAVQLGAIPGVNTAVSNSAQTLNANGAAGFPTTVTNHGSLDVARNATLNLGNHASWTQAGAMNIQANGGYAATLNIGSAAGSSASMTYTGDSPIRLSQITGTSSVSTLTVRGGVLATGQPVQFNGASGNANGYGRLILTNGGALKLNANIPQLATGDSSGRFILSNNGGGIIDTNGFSTTIDRVLIDSNPVTFIGSLTKIGSGTLTLSNTNTYSGTTTITGGTLLVTGSIATSTTTVHSSGTLGGTGTTGAVTVESDGMLAPGGGNTGTLATGPLTLKAGCFSNFQLGTASDRVNVAGSLALGGTITLLDTGSATSGSYTLFTYTGSLAGTPAIIAPAGFAATLVTTTPGLVGVNLSASAFSTWARDSFTSTELANPAISGPDATPAGDGLSNLLKYALGLPPKTPSATGLTTGDSVGDWVVTYRRPAHRSDITYAVEAAPGLAREAWTTNGVVHSRIATGDPETWQARVTPAPADGRLFFRLVVRKL